MHHEMNTSSGISHGMQSHNIRVNWLVIVKMQQLSFSNQCPIKRLKIVSDWWLVRSTKYFDRICSFYCFLRWLIFHSFIIRIVLFIHSFHTENDIQSQERTWDSFCLLFRLSITNVLGCKVSVIELSPSFIVSVDIMKCQYREMLLTGTWPTNMPMLTCDDYDGTNTPERTIDLRTFFVNVKEPATYGNFSFPSGNTPFNGHAMMKFDMDMSVVSVQGGASVSTKNLGNWTASLNSPIMVKSDDDMKNFTAAIVYRVYTVVVSPFIILLQFQWHSSCTHQNWFAIL